MNLRRITFALGAASGGLLAASLLSTPLAFADEIYFTPDPSSFYLEESLGYPPFTTTPEIGGEAWNTVDLTTGTTTAHTLYGTDVNTQLGSFTNDNFVYQNICLPPFCTPEPVPPGTEIDYANYGFGYANEWIDIPGSGTSAGISDLLITPFGDFPLLGTFF